MVLKLSRKQLTSVGITYNSKGVNTKIVLDQRDTQLQSTNIGSGCRVLQAKFVPALLYVYVETAAAKGPSSKATQWVCCQ